MSVFPRPAELFDAWYGLPVTGGARTLPATATGHLFTVAGGRVLVTAVIGSVTTAIQAQACTLSIGNTPSGGSAAVASIATASSSISGLATGSSLGVAVFSGSPPVPAALAVTGASGVTSMSQARRVWLQYALEPVFELHVRFGSGGR